MLNPSQVETCSEPLLRAGKDAARELDVPVHTHAGGNLIEFQRIMDEYRKTPIQFLADIGFLDDRALSATACSRPRTRGATTRSETTCASWPRRGATVGHCPYKYAKMAMTLQLVPALPRRRRDRRDRHRHLPHGHRRRAPLGVHTRQGDGRELPGRPCRATSTTRPPWRAASSCTAPTSAGSPRAPRPTSC